MAAAIALRGDYESAQLRELARQSEDADQERRMPALALARRRLWAISASVPGVCRGMRKLRIVSRMDFRAAGLTAGV